jgi:hypothetical protein
MASPLALMNRAITYFKEPKSGMSATGATSEASETSGTNNEASTDDESNSVECGRSSKVMSNDDYKWEYCEVCDRFLKPRYFMNEEQMCQRCYEITM